MTDFSNPYNFVPLSPFILTPSWATQVSQDQPFQQGICGELAFTLTNHTPLCVGGQQTPSSQNEPGEVHFFRTPEGLPAIPGSSLKGMIRQVMSIATFGHFDQVEDKKLSVRDISQSKNFYHKQVIEPKAQAGWLRFIDGIWQLTPCQFVRVHQRTIIDHFKFNEQAWKSAKTVEARYRLLDGLQSVRFDRAEHQRLSEGIAERLDQGATIGTLVVTGQPGADFSANKSAKKWEFIFYNESDPIPLSQEVITDFLFVHNTGEADSPWRYWKDKTDSDRGIPVFWHPKNNAKTEPASLGLARMYRLAYPHSLHDAIKNTNPQHVDNTVDDFSALIFGHIESSGSAKPSLRGRVNIGMSIAHNPAPFSWTDKTVLNAPKPGFYPAYIRQDADGKLNTLMDKKPELAGWKRYPVKEHHVQQPTGKTNSEKAYVKLETLPGNQIFCGTVRFHNLLPIELGALLWCLDFGERPELRHSLGMGKPFGLGQVSIKVNDAESRLRLNDPSQTSASVSSILGSCRQLFGNYMDSTWQTISANPKAEWLSCEPLREFLAMASPKEAEGRELRYLESPKEYQNVKTNNGRLGSYVGLLEQKVTLDIKAELPQLDSNLNMAIDAYETAQANAEEKQRQILAMQAMQPEQRKLAEIKICLDNPDLLSSKTLKKELEQLIKACLNFGPEQIDKQALEPLLSQAETLDIKVVTKACKKLRSFLEITI